VRRGSEPGGRHPVRPAARSRAGPARPSPPGRPARRRPRRVGGGSRVGVLSSQALAGQREFPAAEALLLDAQKALTERRAKILPLEREVTLREAAERLVRLYEAWGKPDKAEEWRKTLGEHPLDRGFPADPFAR
jgi:hypothetical protein